MKGKKVVVTGGLGFIGSHLAEALVEDNDVTIIDNRSTGTLENLRDFADARAWSFFWGGDKQSMLQFECVDFRSWFGLAPSMG